MMMNRRFAAGTTSGLWLGMGISLLLTLGTAGGANAQAAPAEERSPAAPEAAAEETFEYGVGRTGAERAEASASLEERWAAPFAVASEGRLAPREQRRVVVLDDTAAARLAVESAVSEGLSAGEVAMEEGAGGAGGFDDPEPEAEAAADDDAQSTAEAPEGAPGEGDGPAAPRRHMVSRGDTLYGIARQYGVSAAAIRSANTLSGDIVRLGETLIIPPQEASR